VVNGNVDIVAHLLDIDDAGSIEPGASNVGVYKVRWRACAPGTAGCS
jgi:hypothetical protein